MAFTDLPKRLGLETQIKPFSEFNLAFKKLTKSYLSTKPELTTFLNDKFELFRYKDILNQCYQQELIHSIIAKTALYR